ncbi:exopolysaccharide biosynthesis polyprenyl glycosylphosphotransferase [Sphingomonas naphthae]|uniref:Exopolysaccharide biosynthesis polyprenyl glycosylphosphotransferase n=1 Tax=Sphingomonas naphthae TaxID=1813468 RepID=A0ABY7TFI3_9SPHN|nr:exopolysaccharide biosynthesis polyprenyl glycosylphosphotransferase [Sphingomonas naphthae]WCT71899.1 exopolysaccharide biosynthesis polyprenyl glycosylphosphotransferase [Sphingomonas naphthae]
MRPAVHLALKPSNDLELASAGSLPAGLRARDLDVGRLPRRLAGLTPHLARHARITTELATLTAVLMLGGWLFPSWLQARPESFLWATVLWLVIYAALSVVGRGEILDRESSRIAQRVGYWLQASVVLVMLAFLAKDSVDLARAWILASIVTGGVTIAVLTLLSNRLSTSLHRNGSLGDRLAIYGTDGRIEHLIHILREKAKSYQIDSVFDEEREECSGHVGGFEISRGLDRLIARAKAGHVDAILLNIPWSEQGRIQDVVARLEEVNVDVLLTPSELQFAGRGLQIARCGPLSTIALYQRPMQGIGAVLKIVMDRAAALCALIFFAPLMFLVAAAIKFDSPGPVFFKQRRRGMNNVPFDVYKFRSMHHAAADQNADKLVVRGDARVTRLGAFLRASSLDELPQLINILKGEMSLVGPRPHAYGAKAADRLYEEVVGRYPARHRVLPGLTGLAQVRGFRGNTLHESDITNRIDSDLEYIERWSLSLDIVILVRTAITLFFQKQAY